MSPARSRMPSRPPALFQVNGSSRKKTPMVLRMNWTMSVSVIDHMPPIEEYSITIDAADDHRQGSVGVEQHVEDRRVGDRRRHRQHQRVSDHHDPGCRCRVDAVPQFQHLRHGVNLQPLNASGEDEAQQPAGRRRSRRRATSRRGRTCSPGRRRRRWMRRRARRRPWCRCRAPGPADGPRPGSRPSPSFWSCPRSRRRAWLRDRRR